MKITTHNEPPRLRELDAAKGLAIFLVVLGHLTARGDSPTDHAWYNDILKPAIYSFHMAFFMFLSSFGLRYKYQPITTWAAYRQYASRRLARLGPGFVLFGVITILGKYVTAGPLVVARPPESLLADLGRLFVCPFWSTAGFLWYVQVLLWLALALPGCLALTRQRLWPWLPVSVVLFFVSAPRWFSLDKTCQVAVFFFLGALAAAHLDRWRAWANRWFLVNSVAWAALLLWRPAHSVTFLLVSLWSLPVLYALCDRQPLRDNRLLHHWGRHVFAIYLMHLPVIGLLKALLWKFTTWDGWQFWWIAPALLLGGLTLPVVIKKFVFARFSFLDEITR